MTYDDAAVAASGPGGECPPGPLTSAAALFFGDRLPIATRYAELLATDGVERGLIGPREAPRLWERHLLNCAAMAELIGPDERVLDVGSGAGLPGIVLAIARPDLSIGLVEPLARRTVFLAEVVSALGLDDRVQVIRARAEELRSGTPGAPGPADVVTARAVAPLDRLAGWCLPLVDLGGRLLALKGATAADEVAEHADRIHRLGGGTPTVRRCGVGTLDPPTTVVEIPRERVGDGGTGRRTGKPRRSGGRAGSARGDGGRNGGGRSGRSDRRRPAG
ncbi:16S rRNA (guanine(527)-N(7))-methyltransferase RsmG [Solwaraspora sp. WMMD1047]|uniref:16S rRNA (guanine(527)-N(7))-methyltransferase RsmG n=1 Tax=Solwaraspora sp. WMMD1047 TaxID=3016102 RepID=UPI002416A4D3|nr:16S rRNA (guanine(527)-N(7))-methyltransferase RsmG [Solwaraspora sp. WMMD1047]MDG4834730.1 16S rRNA (guanine(527)-N(7))-methyltransferase RsmG [Solwaraspora sp. WMMD1047]